MENKLLPSAKISTQKLLPSVKISAKRISADSIKGGNSSFGISAEDLSFIKTKVILIRDLLKQQTLVRKEQAEKLRVQKEKQKFKKREKSLEKKSDEKEEKKSILQAPRIGFLERIKNFISKIILGYFTVKLVPFIPKLLQIVPKIVAVGDFITDMSGKLLNGFVEFIDWGYKAHDETKKFLKQIGGSGAEKAFDSFNGAVGKVLDAALIVALTMGDMGGGGGGPGGGRPGRGGRVGSGSYGNSLGWERAKKGRYGDKGGYLGVEKDIRERYAKRYGRDAAIKKFGGVETLGGKYARSGAENLARKGLVSLTGKSGAKAVLKFTRPLLKRLPIIGALLDFGLSVALGEPLGRAAFKAIGAGLLGTIGAALGGPFAVLTGLAGGMLGDWAGGALYDVFFGNKNPSKKKVQGRAEGGSVTRGGRVQGSVKRKVKKGTSRRTVKPTTTKLKPGSAVGGKDKIENIFPETKDSGTANPLGYIEKTYDTTSKIPFFGPIFDIAYKTISGDKATRLDYRNASVGLNSWMNNTFNTEIMRMGAYAGGGEVNAEMFMKGEDLTNVIAKSLEDSISTKIDDAITELQKQLGLKPTSKQAGVPGPSEPGPADLVNIQGGDADFWTLVAVASREDGEPQAWADVAQSIYNRLASGAYTGKSIKDLILGQMQYEPTWKFPRPGATGRPNQEWYAIKDAASAGAAAGQSEGAMKKVAAAILDPTLQKNAREFIQGRTDFRGYTVSGGIQRKSGDNYYGWYNNYKANKIGAVPNFGATATSTGAGPGGGTFTGGGTGSGYGSGGVKIAGDLGDFMKANRNKIGVTGSIHQHPRHPGQFTRSYPSYHNQNRALDIGGYGPAHPGSGGRDEQAPVIRALLEWNKKNGYKPVQIIHGSPAFKGLGKYESAPGALHSNHVHVAYAKGGLVDGVTYAMLGERGREFIIDADSTSAIENTFPGFLSALNKANYEGAINVLKNYAAYEFGSTQEVFVERPEPEMIPVNMGGSSGAYAVPVGDGSSDDYAESLAMSQ